MELNKVMDEGLLGNPPIILMGSLTIIPVILK